MKPDFEKIVREALKDRFGYVDPKLGRKVLRLVEDAFSAGLERAAEIADSGHQWDEPDDIAAAIRSEKEATQ